MSSKDTSKKSPSIKALDYKGLNLKTFIPSSVISIDDLKNLYNQLDAKAGEALEKMISESKKPADQSEEDFNNLKEQARDVGHLTVIIHGGDGEQIVKSSKEIFEKQYLPESINTIIFDSSAGLETLNINMLNRFFVNLDFAETPGFHKYNPWDKPTPNNSVIEVIGADHTWVTAIYETILKFFRSRKKKRAWLHSWITFNILNWLIGIPGSLWFVYRIDTIFSTFFEKLHGVLQGAIYVYVLLFALLIFRLIIGGFRWIFPLIELEGSRSKKIRGILGTVQSALLLALIYDVLKNII